MELDVLQTLETKPIADVSEQEEQTEKHDAGNAALQGNEDHKNIITYQVPLEEIAERIEYEYVYENMTDHIVDQDYKQLSFLPSGEDIAISVYIVEGNKILFLPEEKTNTEAIVNGEPCWLHYCEEADGYVFYLLVDWQVSEDGIPVNSLENDYYYRIRECIVRDKDAAYEKTNLVNSPIYFAYEFELEDLVKLGDTKVTFDPEQTIELPEIPMVGNEYMDAVAEYAAGILRENGIYGSFRIYPETYGRIQNQYVDVPTCGKISAAIIGDGFSDLDTMFSESMVCLGETELTLRELPSLDVTQIEEDEYVTALKEHIEDILRQNGKNGEYAMNIGEYEVSFRNKVCLSAAVTGEEDSYYFRYLIVKSGKGNYYFWPAGFGLNGSLEECGAERHYMNALCIERTEKLERCRIVMEID